MVFSTQLCELLPSNLLSGSTPPPHPLPFVYKYTVYTYTECKVGGVRGSGPQTDKHLPQSPFTGQYFLMMTFCIAFCYSYLSTIRIILLTDRSTIPFTKLDHFEPPPPLPSHWGECLSPFHEYLLGLAGNLSRESLAFMLPLSHSVITVN